MSTIGLWGGFDLESLGAQLALRIVGAELARRLPGVAVRPFAPYGATRPVPFDGGEPVEPLDPPTAAHLRALAGTLDLVVLTGDLALLEPASLAAAYGVAEEVTTPLADLLLSGLPGVTRAWSAVSVPPPVAQCADGCAHLSVVDGASLKLLPRATSVPEPAVLSPRVFPPRALEKRLAFLQAMGWWPGAGTPILVQGGAADVERAATIASELGDQPVVVIEADSGDAAFAHSLAVSLPGSLHIPAIAGVEDRVAAVAAAGAVVSSSTTLRALAVAYRRPHAGLDAPSSPLLPEEPDIGAAILDAEYDTLADLVPDAAPAPLASAEVAAVRAALDARGRRLVAERVLMADHVWSLQAEHEGRLAQWQAEAEALSRENALLRSRWSIRLRTAVGRAVHRPRRPP